MPFCASVNEAASHAPQLGTFGVSTMPTETQAAFIWNRAYDMIRVRLRRAGVAVTFTSSSAGEGWAKDVESRLTSGLLLRAKGSAGRRAEGSLAGGSGDTTAERLIASAMSDLDALMKDRTLREALIADGSRNNLPASPFATSDWLEGKDPDFDTTFNGDDLLYIPGGPVIQDGEPL